MLKIVFRVDGGSEIGMGHVMRCLALANSFSKNINVSFIIKFQEKVINLLEERGYKIKILNSTICYKKEIKEVKNIMKSEKVDILITDAYHIDQNYLSEVKKNVKKLVSISLTDSFAYPSDIVVDGEIYATKLNYQSVDSSSVFLLGTDYVLLREEFQNLPKREIDENIDVIMVTVGGGDPLNLTPKIVQALEKIKKYNFKVKIVIGPAFNNLTEILKKVTKTNLEISLYFNTKKMSQLMLKSDLAISAGGSTLYELAATGTPAVVVLQSKDQLLGAKCLEKEETIINLGFGDKIENRKLIKTVLNLIDDFEKRKKMSQMGQRLVDGKGVLRVKKKILKNSY